ncbi:hypothetical protein KSS87_021520 [Heliosperma pusillum]|nr:hypothetical protein KSS87_021520 [Heliosperma pusillum]
MPLKKGDAAEETLVVMQKKLISKQNKPKTKKRPLEENVDTEETSPKKLKSSNKKKSNGDENKQLATIKPVVDDKMATNKLQTKCRPGQLVELINGLSKEQKEAVREIGFGGLLQLKVTKLPHGILPWILKAFDYTCNMFKLKKTEFIITKDDVHDIFLLPRGGNQVVLAQTGNTVSVTDNRLKKEWRLRFDLQNNSDPITVKRVFETLRGSNDSGDEFKKLFVLFSVSVFLAPTSNKTIDLKLVRAVANVENIRAYDWCDYIFREMVNSVKVFKQGGKSIVSGCILVVMLAYFHRFNFKGDVMGHTLPLISHWDDEKLSKRVQDEKKTGSLGNAPLSKIDYPISLQQQDKLEAVRGTQNSDKGLDEVLEEEVDEEVDEECESKEGYLMVKLPKGVESDKQIKARSIDGAHEIYLRMKRDNELFFSRYVNNMNKLGKMKPTKRNDEPSTSVHDEATEVSAAEEVVVNNEENPSAKQAPSPSLSQTQPALRDPDYHTFIDGLVARSYEKEKAKRGLPTFDIWTDMLKIQYKELNKKYGGCFDRDLLSDDDLECADEENDEEVDVTKLNSDDGGEAEKRNDEEECFDDFVTNIVLGVTSNIEHMFEDTNVVNQKDDIESNVPDKGNQNRDFDDGKPDDGNISAQRCISKYLLHSNVVPASAGMVPYHLGCTLDCGLPNEDLQIVSDFMLKNELLYAPVMQLRKEVMDYCFLNDYWCDKTEIVCNFGVFHNTTKKDIESLLPNTMIEAIVIESWAIMLNKMQMAGSGSTRPRRIFFGIAHSIVVEKMIDIDNDDEDNGDLKKYKAEVFSTWDMWSGFYDEPLNLNAEMVFIPLLYEEHFFCVCIDFVRERLFYLDNRCYDDFDETTFAIMTDVVANTYAEYLVSKGTENAVKVRKFMMINVPFDWQTREHNLDCGVFMMFHMMFFYGDIFDCELYNVEKRDLYRGEIAATLILSDFNGNRSEVLERVTRHNEMKVKLLPKLLSKRERINKKKTKGRAGKKNVQTPDSKIKDMVEDGPASVVGSSRRGKSDGLGCTFNCGMADDKVLLVSKFMRANQALFAKMLSTRKEVLDYCLLDDHNLSLEYDFSTSLKGTQHIIRGCCRLWRWSITYQRGYLSLRPTVPVNTAVIECWALILNHIEHTEKSETSLMFFGIGHMEGKGDENKDQNIQKLFDTWDEFVSKNTVPCNWKADLVFVPMVWEDHYFCVCINFTREMVEVLDNTKYDQWEETIIYKAADLLVWFTDTSELVMKLSLTASHMSDYLEGKGDERAVDLIAFPVVHIKFNWQTYEENNIESGNFLMMHMIRLTKDEIWKEVKPKRGKTGTVKEKKGAAEEEVDKVDSFTKEKEDTIEITRINTEIPVLHNPPRQYDTIQGDIEDGQPKRVFKRYKRPAHSRGRGQSRGRGRNYSQ